RRHPHPVPAQGQGRGRRPAGGHLRQSAVGAATPVSRQRARLKKDGLSMPNLVMRTIKLAALLACAVAWLQPAAAQTLRIGTEGAYPPFEYRDASGTLKGMDVEIGNALCARMKVTCQFMPQDFDGLIPAIKAGKID